jgi:hypothetical protein
MTTAIPKQGDVFLTSGLDRIYPKGLPVGDHIDWSTPGPVENGPDPAKCRPGAFGEVICVIEIQGQTPSSGVGNSVSVPDFQVATRKFKSVTVYPMRRISTLAIISKFAVALVAVVVIGGFCPLNSGVRVLRPSPDLLGLLWFYHQSGCIVVIGDSLGLMQDSLRRGSWCERTEQDSHWFLRRHSPFRVCCGSAYSACFRLIFVYHRGRPSGYYTRAHGRSGAGASYGGAYGSWALSAFLILC